MGVTFSDRRGADGTRSIVFVRSVFQMIPAGDGPEQAQGKVVDKRADIRAFGAVLFEMLTRTRAFDGDGVSETPARIIEREPAWNRLPARLSPTLRTYLGRCLQKDQRQRIRDIGDVHLATTTRSRFLGGDGPSEERPYVTPNPIAWSLDPKTPSNPDSHPCLTAQPAG